MTRPVPSSPHRPWFYLHNDPISPFSPRTFPLRTPAQAHLAATQLRHTHQAEAQYTFGTVPADLRVPRPQATAIQSLRRDRAEGRCEPLRGTVVVVSGGVGTGAVAGAQAKAKAGVPRTGAKDIQGYGQGNRPVSPPSSPPLASLSVLDGPSQQPSRIFQSHMSSSPSVAAAAAATTDLKKLLKRGPQFATKSKLTFRDCMAMDD